MINSRVHLRWMLRRDLPQVLAIDHAGFAFPWSEEEFLRLLRDRNIIGMVAEQGERVVGFFIYELNKDRLHVHRFAVHPEFRHQGVGSTMVAKLVGKLSCHRRDAIDLYCRESNLDACLFWRASGFRAVEILRGHYRDTDEDAYRFVREIDDGVEASLAPIEVAEPQR